MIIHGNSEEYEEWSREAAPDVSCVHSHGAGTNRVVAVQADVAPQRVHPHLHRGVALRDGAAGVQLHEPRDVPQDTQAHSRDYVDRTWETWKPV